MQTFLPHADFARSAAALDRQRLGKQRVEVIQLLRTLRGDTRGWRNHPAARMWAGHEASLAAYGEAVCLEWRGRGYKDTCLEKIRALAGAGPAEPPAWLGNERLHASHRSNLLRKDAAWYSQFGWVEGPELPYWWPVETRTNADAGQPVPPA